MSERFQLRPSVTIVDGKIVYDTSPDLIRKNEENQQRIARERFFTPSPFNQKGRKDKLYPK